MHPVGNLGKIEAVQVNVPILFRCRRFFKFLDYIGRLWQPAGSLESTDIVFIFIVDAYQSSENVIGLFSSFQGLQITFFSYSKHTYK